MALITSFELRQKDRHTVHRPTRCLYSIVEGEAGERYFQFDTLGSEERQIPDKVSQSIRFNRDSAKQLIELLRETFPGIE